MATNTPHPVRSARRCILRTAVAKLVFATAVAVATSLALALLGALDTAPQLAKASGKSGTKALSGQAFGYPIKPLNEEHPIRGNFGDPRMQFFGPPTLSTLMHGTGSFSFHQGVDISAPNGTAVYPVVDGTVTAMTSIWVRVSSGDRAFEYWHITPQVHLGQQVTADETVLGRILRPAHHVHLTEYENGRVVNPLVPGRLTPYHDSTRPTVRSISLRRGDSSGDLFPTFVRGRVEIVADAYDLPTMAVPGEWHGLPTTPALISWRIQEMGRVVVPERIAVDYRTTVPGIAAFWRVYARGTYQNMCVFGQHYSYLQRGDYLFKLASQFDTRTLRDGVYDLVVTATDVRGNSDSQTLRFTVHNRRGWSG